jgi:osmoprotectant transport system substrate-binding protein/osmoprotectant transport system permease protein
MRMLLTPLPWAAAVVVACSIGITATAAPTLNVGSKRFTESYILGEIIKQSAQGAGEIAATHSQGLGNTAIVLNALTTGSIDVYPEYTGTIAREILKLDQVPPLAELNAKLASMGLAVAVPLGFNNTYALAMRGDDARAKGIARLSDLKAHPELRLGLSQEFIGRADGWPGLKRVYDLPFTTPRGLDHGLAYEAIAERQVDAIDIYSTDAKIDRYGLTVLADDRKYFPRYDAVLLYRADLPQRLPKTWDALKQLEGTIDDAAMRRMNAAAELDNKDFATVAASFLAQRPGAVATAAQAVSTSSGARPANDLWHKIFGPDFGRLTFEHLTLVFLSLAASIVLGIPLGILAAKRPATEAVILGATGVVQTIPSLALLAVLIPLTGRIGAVPAFIALSLYALLPIVRNTHTALTQISRGMKEAALSLGMRAGTILHKIELPLAAPTIMAGIKTSAVINVGTATIAAFIGAGGYGERIVTGLALNDHGMLLAGALPAAALALLIEAGFRIAERWLIPAGLRRLPQR